MLDNLNLIHMNGRVYDPMIGRFLSADPLIDGALKTQGWNRYSYVHNNPLSATDPSGFWMWDPPWQSRWQNPCPPDTRLCWVPFPGHFYDGVFDDFISQSRNARYGDSRISDESTGPPPMISPTTPTDSVDAWQSTNRKCPGIGMSGLVVTSCTMSLDDIFDVNFLGHPIFATLNDALDSVVARAAQIVGPLGDRAVQAVSDLESNGSKHEVLGTLAAALDSNNAANTISLSIILAATIATDGTAELAAAARGTTTALSEIRYTQAGEKFLRYESANPAFSRVTPRGGVTPGTYAAPASDGLVPVGQRISTYNLPSPNIPRTNYVMLEPPPGTPVIGPRTVVGGTGNEVIFPFGF
jgi:RHS repeat-associated protein